MELVAFWVASRSMEDATRTDDRLPNGNAAQRVAAERGPASTWTRPDSHGGDGVSGLPAAGTDQDSAGSPPDYDADGGAADDDGVSDLSDHWNADDGTGLRRRRGANPKSLKPGSKSKSKSKSEGPKVRFETQQRRRPRERKPASSTYYDGPHSDDDGEEVQVSLIPPPPCTPPHEPTCHPTPLDVLSNDCGVSVVRSTPPSGGQVSSTHTLPRPPVARPAPPVGSHREPPPPTAVERAARRAGFRQRQRDHILVIGGGGGAERRVGSGQPQVCPTVRALRGYSGHLSGLLVQGKREAADAGALR